MNRLRLSLFFASRVLVGSPSLLAGCGEMPTQEQAPSADAAAAEQAYSQGDLDRAAQLYLDISYSNPRDAAHYKLRAAEAYRENGELDQAAQALAGIKPQRLNPEESGAARAGAGGNRAVAPRAATGVAGAGCGA